MDGLFAEHNWFHSWSGGYLVGSCAIRDIIGRPLQGANGRGDRCIFRSAKDAHHKARLT